MNAPEAGIPELTIAWAHATPRVRRVWLVGKSAKGKPRGDREVELAVEAEPVADSEETLIVWLNEAGRWQGELERRIGRSVGLEWLDPDGHTPELQRALREASVLVYDRAAAI